MYIFNKRFAQVAIATFITTLLALPVGAAQAAGQPDNGQPSKFYVDYSYLNRQTQQPPTVTAPEKEPEAAPGQQPSTKEGETGNNTSGEQSLPAGLTAEEREMISLLNKERTSRGLSPLEVDMRLVGTAREKSRDMIANGYFGHNSPALGSPFDQMRKAGVNYRYAGENLAGASTVQKAHTNLMNSASHRKNILNPRFTHIGIGIVAGGPYGRMFTQHFVQL